MLSFLAVSLLSAPVHHAVAPSTTSHVNLRTVSTEMLFALNPGATKKYCDDCVAAQKVAIAKEQLAEQANELFQNATKILLESTKTAEVVKNKVAAQTVVVEKLKGALNAQTITLYGNVELYNSNVESAAAALKQAKVRKEGLKASDISRADGVLEASKATIAALQAELATLLPQVKLLEGTAAKLKAAKTQLSDFVDDYKDALEELTRAQVDYVAAKAAAALAKKNAAAALANAEKICALITNPEQSPAPEPAVAHKVVSWDVDAPAPTKVNTDSDDDDDATDA